MFIFNKNAATPPWCLVSSALTAWIWVLAYWAADVRQSKSWIAALAPAGQNALLAYILAPVVYAIIQLFADAGMPFYKQLGASFATGLWRSLVFATAITWIAGRLRHKGVTLRV